MGNKQESKTPRIAVMLDMTWPLRRHIDVFAGIARYASERANWTCVLDDFVTDTIQESRKRAYDGVIARATPELAKLARQRRIPLVNVWFNSPVKDVPTVTIDSAKAGRLAGDHFIDRGIRNVICLVRRGDRAEFAEAQAIRSTLREEDGSCQINRVSPQFAHSRVRWRETRDLLEHWLRHTPLPAGLYAGVDILGRLVAQSCADMGIDVPRDLAIVAGHNEPTLCDYPEPTLTSIDMGFDRVGHEAARLMDDMLNGGSPPAKMIQIPPRQIVVRQSSDFLYVNEPLIADAIQFIANHIRNPISVEDVAEAVGVSRRNLETRFKAHVHRTVAEEMRRIRMEHAKRLLAGQQTSIANIAKVAGYSSNAQMSRLFQRELGMSPRDYRNTFEQD